MHGSRLLLAMLLARRLHLLGRSHAGGLLRSLNVQTKISRLLVRVRHVLTVFNYMTPRLVQIRYFLVFISIVRDIGVSGLVSRDVFMSDDTIHGTIDVNSFRDIQ